EVGDVLGGRGRHVPYEGGVEGGRGHLVRGSDLHHPRAWVGCGIPGGRRGRTSGTAAHADSVAHDEAPRLDDPRGLARQPPCLANDPRGLDRQPPCLADEPRGLARQRPYPADDPRWRDRWPTCPHEDPRGWDRRPTRWDRRPTNSHDGP